MSNSVSVKKQGKRKKQEGVSEAADDSLLERKNSVATMDRFSSKSIEPDYERLLSPCKTVRDPVHGDITLNHFEVAIIDTRDFQRLRSMKQLGTTYLVYPGANHTRFEHALGTLYMVQLMIDKINSNSPEVKRGGIVEKRMLLLTRACALLHDFVNVPFGHTLETEGGLFAPEWKDGSRAKILLSPERKGGVGQIIVGLVDKEFLNEITAILSATDNEELAKKEGYPIIEKLDHPYVADIVGNTVCADILDYLRRDIYYTGIQDRYDERFLTYLYIENRGKNKNRLVIRLWKKGRMRRDVLSELLKLLRLRYSMAERVYFHHTKVAASAMIIRAVDDFLGDGNSTTLLEHGDESLLALLENRTGTISQKIVEKLRRRQLYKCVYECPYIERKAEEAESEHVHKNAQRYRDEQIRRTTEEQIEAQNLLNPGSVIIYDPDPDMQLKEADVRVLWQDEETVFKLSDKALPEPSTKNQVEEIKALHRHLWKLRVFLDPRLAVDKDGKWTGLARNVAYDCEQIFKVTNGIPDLRPTPEERDFRERAIERLGDMLARHPEKKQLTHPEKKSLLQRAEREFKPQEVRLTPMKLMQWLIELRNESKSD